VSLYPIGAAFITLGGPKARDFSVGRSNKMRHGSSALVEYLNYSLGVAFCPSQRRKNRPIRLQGSVGRRFFVKFDKIRSFLVFLEHWQLAFL
jgi:hypothetical protein